MKTSNLEQLLKDAVNCDGIDAMLAFFAVKEFQALTAERDALQAIVDRLPRTADGVIFGPCTHSYGKWDKTPAFFAIVEVEENGRPRQSCAIRFCETYSNQEAAREAQKSAP